jgi:hypothetical protein
MKLKLTAINLMGQPIDSILYGMQKVCNILFWSDFMFYYIYKADFLFVIN